MVGLSTILEAAVRGLRVRLDGDRLQVRGPRSEELLAQELLARKAEVIAVLKANPQLIDLDRFAAEVLLLSGRQLLDESESGLAGPFVPLEEVAGGVGASAQNDPGVPCRCCGSARWWRLRVAEHRPAGRWVCARCHPPIIRAEAIETRVIEEGAP